MAEFTGFLGPTYQSRSLNMNAQRCVNFIPEVDKSGGKSSLGLFGTPGLALFANMGAYGIRGARVVGDSLYAVAGAYLYSLNALGTVSSTLGMLKSSVGRVMMEDNGSAPTGGDEIFFTDGLAGYLYNHSTSWLPFDTAATGFTIDGAGQSGASLNVDADTAGAGNKIYKDSWFTIAGINEWKDGADTGYPAYFRVTADATTAADGTCTVAISPSLTPSGASRNVTASPADNAVITFTRFAKVVDDVDTCTYINGKFVANYTDETGRYRCSNLYSGGIWDDLDVSTADSSPDALRRVMNVRGQLVLFGEDTTELWYDSGTGYPPFARTEGAVIDHGIAAKHSACIVDNTVVWLAKSGHGKGYVVRANGYTPQVISNPALEYEWNTYGSISDAFAYAYTDEGHTYYVLTFPTGNATWVYDFTTGAWHERSSYSDNPYQINRHCGNAYVYYNGKHLIGDYRNGNIYHMSSEYVTDNGEPIVSMRRAVHVAADSKRAYVSDLEIQMQTGCCVDDNTEHFCTLRSSKDNGYTWGNERTKSIGRYGQYKKRVRWSQLGSSRDRVFELTISAPVKRFIVGASIELAGGVS